jgi:hypothetical protein
MLGWSCRDGRERRRVRKENRSVVFEDEHYRKDDQNILASILGSYPKH